MVPPKSFLGTWRISKPRSGVRMRSTRGRSPRARRAPNRVRFQPTSANHTGAPKGSTPSGDADLRAPAKSTDARSPSKPWPGQCPERNLRGQSRHLSCSSCLRTICSDALCCRPGWRISKLGARAGSAASAQSGQRREVPAEEQVSDRERARTRNRGPSRSAIGPRALRPGRTLSDVSEVCVSVSFGVSGNEHPFVRSVPGALDHRRGRDLPACEPLLGLPARRIRRASLPPDRGASALRS